ncbi:uncharacterized protein BXZ73DRAFT_44521 [Epithele typhae]|uniref:uncharacterized protein n=1 Tax=Epithele typhae TaxID=378194 RepID=UPI0020082AA4|nr:uncharacterized protein BXZ73DRAFT_44521 [Epithele typhae]KAH9938810.1 hypothetical protein BXZ73DRAFT_44521 [Epithele typhae]
MDAAGATESTDISGAYLELSATPPPLLRGPQGIVLHVDGHGKDDAEVLTFRKALSHTVNVGRKSAGPGERGDDGELRVLSDSYRALFRCPVVSRRHARFEFTEFGNVYITDLHSHHGTHILRPGELVSTSLKPETPTVISDGDLVTFGKSVGRDAFLVRPVVARVELVFGGGTPSRAPTPPPNLLAGIPSPRSALLSYPPLAPDDMADHGSPPPSGRAGRYGVFLPSPESSPSSSSSEPDSDHEASLPASPPPLRFRRGCTTGIGLHGGSRTRLSLLQRLLPPIHQLPFADAELDPFPTLVPPVWYPGCDNDAEMEQEEAMVQETNEEDMDLSSSRSRSPEVHEEAPPVESNEVEELSVVGAYPNSPERDSSSPEPSHSPEPSSPEVEIVEPNKSAREWMPFMQAQPMDLLRGVAESVEDAHSPAPEAENEHIVISEFGIQAGDGAASQIILEASILKEQIAETSVSIAPHASRLNITDAPQHELTLLREARERDDEAFGEHVQDTKERMDSLGVRVDDAYTSIAAHDISLLDAQARLQSLGAAVSDLHRRTALAEGIDELTREVSAAKDMLLETCELQRQTRVQMEREVQAVVALRAEAKAATDEAKAATAEARAAAAQLESSTAALKRKRSCYEDDDANESASGECGHIAPLPKRRRVAQVVSTIAQTTTVAALGAAAAWAALAFS